MIKKAVITAAGKGTRQYPATNAVQKELFPLVDLDGIAKPTIQIVAEQALRAGIEEICIIVNPGEAEQFRRHFVGLEEPERVSFEKKGKAWGLEQSELLLRLKESISYVEQTEQHGFGHAVWCAQSFVNDEPFLLLLGDHVYVSDQESCIRQAVCGFEQVEQTLFPVAQTPADQLHLFGTLKGLPVDGQPGLYRVTDIVEKPSPELARQTLATPGLPEDRFFTFFGIYALSPKIMHILEAHVQKNVRSGGEVQLTTALEELNRNEGTFALEIDGQRLDMGTPLGYLETQLTLALKGPFRQAIQGLFLHYSS